MPAGLCPGAGTKPGRSLQTRTARTSTSSSSSCAFFCFLFFVVVRREAVPPMWLDLTEASVR